MGGVGVLFSLVARGDITLLTLIPLESLKANVESLLALVTVETVGKVICSSTKHDLLAVTKASRRRVPIAQRRLLWRARRETSQYVTHFYLKVKARIWP